MYGPGSFSSRRIPQDAPRARKEPVLAVGGRAIVRSGKAFPPASLTEHDGMTVIATLGDGIVVEIMAWLPRRNAGALYRVRPTTGDRREGWMSASSLESVPVLHERKSVQPAAQPARSARAKATRRVAARA